MVSLRPHKLKSGSVTYGDGIAVRLTYLLCAALLLAGGSVPGAQAKDNQAGSGYSQPVVQALPSREALELKAALSRLGRNPRDISALLDAGDAASALGDYEAASGFYKRARQISPDNPRALVGLAGSMVHDGDPFSAIPLFERAEKAGANRAGIGGDRGLAYDLVGDPLAAQRYYRLALVSAPDDEVSRRLAISLAIAGQTREAEKVLLPLLREQDKAAWRARAFVLAIAGKTKNAIKITKTLLPADLADSIKPYLEYMPRLTAAQQAAAANLGKFPRASEIGRIDPRVAMLKAQATDSQKVATLDGALVPKGASLGSTPAASAAGPSAAKLAVADSERKRVATKTRQSSKKKKKSRRVAPPEPKPSRIAGSVAEPMLASDARVQTPAEILSGADRATNPSAAPRKRSAKPKASASDVSTPSPRPSEVLSGKPAVAATPPAGATPDVAAAQPGTGGASPGFDLARLPNSTGSAARGAGSDSGRAREASFSNVFQDIGAPEKRATPASGAVDILKVKPAKAPPRAAKQGASSARAKKPTPPSHPSRIWVQLGIGQKTSALSGDWRRLSRRLPALFKGRKAYVSKLNRTNRMLAGPFGTRKEANAFVARLREAGVGGPYVWSSPAGQVVDPL